LFPKKPATNQTWLPSTKVTSTSGGAP